jgi:sulfatase maturation enzyme AslB (radical SAM superfamily)
MGDTINTRDSISFDKMMEICDDFIKMGVKAVTFSGGGEPLIYKNIDIFFDKLLNAGIKIAVITNGSNLKGKIANSLANKASWVRISMDGWDNESYIKYRKTTDGEFDRIISNIKEFAKIKGSTKLSIAYNVDKDNYSRIYDYTKLIKEIGADTVKFTGCIVYDDMSKNIDYHSQFFDLTTSIIERAKTDFETNGFEIQNVYSVQQDRYEKTYERCPFAEYLTIIGADLNVYACHDKAYTESGELGSIKNQTFYDFWMNGEAKKAITNINPCVDCNHHCAADAKNKLLLEYMSIDSEHMDFI